MIKGIDISKWQGAVNWDSIKSSVDFCIFRSSYGVGYKDAQFARNIAEARRTGVLTGCYHYSYPELNTAEKEANWFCDVYKPEAGEIMVLDIEEKIGSDPVGWSLSFLKVIENRYGFKPMIYLNSSLLKSYNWQPVVDNGNGLWLANYGKNIGQPGTKPSAGKWPFIAIWQYSSKCNIAGISPVDGNIFYGTKESFKKYGKQNEILNPSPVSVNTSNNTGVPNNAPAETPPPVVNPEPPVVNPIVNETPPVVDITPPEVNKPDVKPDPVIPNNSTEDVKVPVVEMTPEKPVEPIVEPTGAKLTLWQKVILFIIKWFQ